MTNTLASFESGGVEELTKWREGDSDNELAAFDALMRTYWREHPPSTVKEAAAQLGEATGVKRSVTAVRDFMKRLGLRRRKAGSMPGKADPEKQRRFVREVIEPRMSAAEGGTEAAYFMDASHFVFGAFLGHVWCLAGIFVPTAPGRQRYHALGAVDIVGGTLLAASTTDELPASRFLSVKIHRCGIASDCAGKHGDAIFDGRVKVRW